MIPVAAAICSLSQGSMLTGGSRDGRHFPKLRIPMGKVTFFAGRPDCGKSLVQRVRERPRVKASEDDRERG